jgi:hypothetical protein
MAWQAFLRVRMRQVWTRYWKPDMFSIKNDAIQVHNIVQIVLPFL